MYICIAFSIELRLRVSRSLRSLANYIATEKYHSSVTGIALVPAALVVIGERAIRAKRFERSDSSEAIRAKRFERSDSSEAIRAKRFERSDSSEAIRAKRFERIETLLVVVQ